MNFELSIHLFTQVTKGADVGEEKSERQSHPSQGTEVGEIQFCGWSWAKSGSEMYSTGDWG
jgi:hypothetical protein